ncbi:outer membrane beta-barrel protein [Salmonirosea aquatica]|uniref:Outer membrane beta-barrel protein n=1 Tax=Salmonirosea aquatica TaxID=2654236 RepID=A0A7C9F2F4_9BACT|nr:outer membrane beta-barrel protein [Cytophagaceae bacterium SJW1-29]
MKNLLLSFLFISLFNPILAQTQGNLTGKDFTHASMQKGQWFLGLNGTGGLGRGNVSDSDTWSATGQAGYFIANRWITGIQVSYGAYHAVNKLAAASSMFPQPAWKRNERFITPELFTRYYFTSGKVKPFAQLSGGWNFQTREATYFIGENTQASASNFTAKAGLGVSFRLSKRINLDLMYNRSILSKQQPGDFNGLRLGLTFLIGK